MKNKYFYLLVSLFLLGSCSSNTEVSMETSNDNTDVSEATNEQVENSEFSEEKLAPMGEDFGSGAMLDGERPEMPEGTESFDNQRPPRGEMMGSGSLDHDIDFAEEGEKPENLEEEYSDSESSAS